MITTSHIATVLLDETTLFAVAKYYGVYPVDVSDKNPPPLRYGGQATPSCPVEVLTKTEAPAKADFAMVEFRAIRLLLSILSRRALHFVLLNNIF